MKTTNYTNILVIKPSALGDIVHALPVLPSLRAAFPQAKLTWLVRKEFAPLLECTEGLDEMLLFDRKGMAKWFCCPRAFRCLCDFRKQLREGHFDLVLDLQGLLRSAIFAKMTGCSRRVGMKEAREFAHLFYTHQVDRPDDSVHILDTYFAILKSVGVQSCSSDCTLTAPIAAQDSIRRKLEAAQLTPKKFLVLIPSSAHAYKCWPAEQFAKLAEAFHRQHGWEAVVVGTESDRSYAEAVRANTDSPVVDLTGQTSIPELVALFDQAAAAVSNDTGPGHIALATGTPAVVIFGNTNPLRLGPYQRPECVVAVDPEKRGIEIKDTNPAHRIENVMVEMVLEKIELQLAK
ncbi:MAG: glycosyltransferase family 9 protein [Planctomycetes bacterium]|nr:glycosyltransferase family 9 protein [Planctomycetota bacterium]